jgi:uncharacterized membrane protein YoaK (UPF0700 family)
VVIQYIRRLTSSERTVPANEHLGLALAFVAGAANEGGFLAVHQYTSHMTGILSAVAGETAAGAFELAFTGASGILFFVTGAISSTWLIHYARRRSMESVYALPLLIEALLLILFGVLGAKLSTLHTFFVPITVILLCFIMGMQNALITKLSGSVIRTTHVTGMMTDIGIELGRMSYPKQRSQRNAIESAAPQQGRLKILTFMVGSFFLGGVSGAIGFKFLGYSCTVPLALILIVLASAPLISGVTSFIRQCQRK